MLTLEAKCTATLPKNIGVQTTLLQVQYHAPVMQINLTVQNLQIVGPSLTHPGIQKVSHG